MSMGFLEGAGQRHVAVALLSIAVASTCCSTGPTGQLPTPPGEDARTAIHSLCIRSTHHDGEVQVDTPPRGWLAGMAAGSLQFGREALELASDPSGDVACAIVFLLTPVIVVAGGVYGAVASLPVEQIDSAEAEVRSELARGLRPMDDRFLDACRLAVEDLTITGEAEADAVLEVGTLQIALLGPCGVDPQLSLTMDVDLRLVRTADAAVLYEATLRAAGAHRHLLDWVEEPQRLNDEIERMRTWIAERITEELFLVCLPPEG